MNIRKLRRYQNTIFYQILTIITCTQHVVSLKKDHEHTSTISVVSIDYTCTHVLPKRKLEIIRMPHAPISHVIKTITFKHDRFGAVKVTALAYVRLLTRILTATAVKVPGNTRKMFLVRGDDLMAYVTIDLMNYHCVVAIRADFSQFETLSRRSMTSMNDALAPLEELSPRMRKIWCSNQIASSQSLKQDSDSSTA